MSRTYRKLPEAQVRNGNLRVYWRNTRSYRLFKNRYNKYLISPKADILDELDELGLSDNQIPNVNRINQRLNTKFKEQSDNSYERISGFRESSWKPQCRNYLEWREAEMRRLRSGRDDL